LPQMGGNGCMEPVSLFFPDSGPPRFFLLPRAFFLANNRVWTSMTFTNYLGIRIAALPQLHTSPSPFFPDPRPVLLKRGSCILGFLGRCSRWFSLCHGLPFFFKTLCHFLSIFWTWLTSLVVLSGPRGSPGTRFAKISVWAPPW